MAGRAAVTVLIARGLLVAAGTAGAVEAAAQTRTLYRLNVQTEIEHDSNPNMTIGDSPGTTWLRVVPNLTLGYVVGNEEFNVEAAVTAEKSSNQDAAEDRLDPRLRGVWKHVDALNTAQVFALVDRRALRALDVREQVPVGVDGARTLYSVGGTWTRELGPRSKAGVDLRQDWNRYTDVQSPDYQLIVGAARYTWQQDERRSWYVGVNGQHYRSDGSDDAPVGATDGTSSTVNGAIVGIAQSITDTLHLDASAGAMHFNHPSNDGWQGALTLDYTGERWTAGIGVARIPAVNSSFGGLVVTDEGRVRLHYDIGPATRLEVAAAYSRQSDPESKRTFASAAWIYQWKPAWQIAVRASLNRQQVPEGTARSNRIALVLTYSATDL